MHEEAPVDERCELRDDTLAARQGRQFVRDLLDRHGVDGDLGAVIELLTSELVTNAVVHGTGPRGLRCRIEDGRLTVLVSDGSETRPVVRSPTVLDPHGRGMQLVADLSERWGVEVEPGQGKVVWFSSRLDIADV